MGDVYTLTGVSVFVVCTVCRAQCKSRENKSAQPTDQGCHSTSCAVDTGSARQSALLCPRWPSAAGSGSHRSPRDLASQQPTSMQVAWVSESIKRHQTPALEHPSPSHAPGHQTAPQNIWPGLSRGCSLLV